VPILGMAAPEKAEGLLKNLRTQSRMEPISPGIGTDEHQEGMFTP
jgi:hypothetical protein